jgi:nucleoside-diphosphate-sugar epimerase
VRGPLDIQRAQKDLAYKVQYELREALDHFVKTLRSR